MDTEITIGDALPDNSIPVLFDGPPLNLPAAAVVNADGSVTLPFDYPVVLQYRVPGTDQVARSEPFDQFILRRLTGAEVRKVIGAKSPTEMALGLSSGLGAGKLKLLLTKLNARDEAAANNVVSELLGGFDGSLPEHAEKTPDGIVLPILSPKPDEAGEMRTLLLFKHLTSLQRRQAIEAPNLLNWAISLATGLTPKDAGAMFDAADGADAMAVNKVILFLCGSGR